MLQDVRWSVGLARLRKGGRAIFGTLQAKPQLEQDVEAVIKDLPATLYQVVSEMEDQERAENPLPMISLRVPDLSKIGGGTFCLLKYHSSKKKHHHTVYPPDHILACQKYGGILLQLEENVQAEFVSRFKVRP